MARTVTVTPSDGQAKRKRGLCERIFTGDAGLGLNLLCCPCVQAFWSLYIYTLPCVAIYAWRALYFVVKRLLCACCIRYSDKSFPPNSTSIGDWRGKNAQQIDAEIKWERASTYYARRLSEAERKADVRVKLFEQGIDVKDIAQGQVGNCWLIAALASVAEYPGLVRKVMLSKTASARGKYSMRLFDWNRNRWVTITVDENMPLKDDRPLFAQPHGHELWVSMLEKGFAKFCGSYAALDGGQTAWAFNALTGDPVFKLVKSDEGGQWERLEMKIDGSDPKNKRACQFFTSGEKHASDEVFFLVRKYAKRESLLGASFGSYGSKEEGGGKGLNGEDLGPQG